MLIDHNPHEGKKYPNWHAHLRPGSHYERRAKQDSFWYLFPLVFFLLALGWCWYFAYQTPNWVSLGLGFLTGMMVMAWTVDRFGNRPANNLFSNERREPPAE